MSQPFRARPIKGEYRDAATKAAEAEIVRQLKAHIAHKRGEAVNTTQEPKQRFKGDSR